MPKMRASFQGLVQVLAKSLYPEPDVFIRELLQNAHDSIQLRRVADGDHAGEIRIDVDDRARTLSFSDNGTGMDQRDIEEFLSVIGSTGTGSRAQELASRDIAVATIGQFGIGLLSAFVVAERIDVYTRKPGAVQTWRWTNYGGEDYELVALSVDAQSPGTRVVVTLASHQTAFLGSQRLRQTVRRYADHQRDIEEFLSVIGSTGTGSRAQELASRTIAVATIGQFGIGLLSAFVVAERIDVYTRKPGAAQTWRWTHHGGEDYELVALPVEAQPPGTRVVVTLAPHQTVFLDRQRLRQTVRRYADLLPFPILLNGFGPINAVNAPWHEPGWCDPVERDRLLAAFLSQRYADPLLLVIPVDLPHPRTLGGLYVAARYTLGGQAGGHVDLFQARMCIRLNDRELLPEWASFVRGVVDCPDLQPTAARDNVLRDSAYHALREALGKIIVAALLDLAIRNRPHFLRLCDWHQDALKGMAAQHPDFGAAVLDALPFATSQGQLTLPDYLARQPPGANGKRSLYFFTHEADANQFYPLCQAHGVLGVNAGGAFDETLLRHYVSQHPDQVELKPLDRLDNSALYPPLDVAAQLRYAPPAAGRGSGVDRR